MSTVQHLLEGQEFDLQDLQILMPFLALFLNQALKHFFEVSKIPEYWNQEAWACLYLDCVETPQLLSGGYRL